MRQQTHLLRLQRTVLRNGRGKMLVFWTLMTLLVVGGAPSLQAQQLPPSELQKLSPAAKAEAGLRLLHDDRMEEAVPLLEAAMNADSSLVVQGKGAVAYWLGVTYEQREEPEAARSTWQDGMRALWASDQFDVRLADAYLRHLSPEELRGERLQAVNIYQTLLGEVRPDTSSALKNLYRRRVAQIAPLMSDDVLGRVIEEERSADAESWTFQAEAGQVLQEWWRGLDPFSQTEENERLEEHLGRLVQVQQDYECTERTSGLDDRGIIQLRFGSPYKQQSIDYQNGKFFREVFRFGVHVSSSDFPESEIWLYPHIDDSGYYLFAEESSSDCYHIAEANDLLPRHLTMRRSDSERGLNIAYSALMAMEAVYRELALYHIDFGSRYNEIANYANYQEMQATQAEVREMTGGGDQTAMGEQQAVVGEGVGQTRRVFADNILGIDFPNQFVPRMVSRAEREDANAAERRKEAMPRQHTTLLDRTAHLPVAVRTARFLTRDGRTQTEVYWGIPSSALKLEPSDDSATAPSSLLSLSIVQYDAGHESRQQVQRRYRLPSDPASNREAIIPPPVVLDGTSELAHLGLQWTQYQLWQTGSEGGTMGPKRRLATARADSLEPLRSDGTRIEMSDVKVLSLPASSTPPSVDNLTAKATPYPFRTITTGIPLLLSFEVYHLTFDANDRTRYTVAYEAKGETDRGWTRLFRGQDTQRTSTEMTMEGSDRRTEETILLDLSQIDQDETQKVRVTVRVTDEITGETVARDLDFTLEPDDS